MSISGILLFDFVIPKEQLQTADASASTGIARECGNFSNFLLKISPCFTLGNEGHIGIFFLIKIQENTGEKRERLVSDLQKSQIASEHKLKKHF